MFDLYIEHSSPIYLLMKRQRYDIPLRILCALLFSLFSFLYIYLFQGELLALMQDYLSKGVTESNAFWAALIITSLLLLLQKGVNRLSKLHGAWEAVSYFPSCVLLALLTDVNEDTMLYSLARWAWGVPLCILIFIAIVWVNRMVNISYKKPFFGLLWPNLMVFSFLFVLTAQVSNNAPVSHMELAAWRYMHDEEYEKVLEIGSRLHEHNAELTALRNVAMAKTNQLGDKLFHYPQPYGADGLLYNKYNRQTTRYGAQLYYSYLGMEAYGGESGRAFATRMYQTNDSAIYRDIYLAALLLDKDLPAFIKESADISTEGSLPVHFQEAYLLYNELHPDEPISFVSDSVVEKRFSDYRILQRAYKNNVVVAKNLSRLRFGNTYWCYYDY